MPNERIREAYLLYLGTGSVGDKADYFKELLRAGEVLEEEVTCAAFCGCEASQQALEKTYPKLSEEQLEKAFTRWGIEVANAIAYALVNAVRLAGFRTGLEAELNLLCTALIDLMPPYRSEPILGVAFSPARGIIDRTDGVEHRQDPLHQFVFTACQFILAQSNPHDRLCKELASLVQRLIDEQVKLTMNPLRLIGHAISNWKLNKPE